MPIKLLGPLTLEEENQSLPTLPYTSIFPVDMFQRILSTKRFPGEIYILWKMPMDGKPHTGI